jgi:hypothetical protein
VVDYLKSRKEVAVRVLGALSRIFSGRVLPFFVFSGRCQMADEGVRFSAMNRA